METPTRVHVLMLLVVFFDTLFKVYLEPPYKCDFYRAMLM